MIETLSLLEFATNSVPPLRYSTVGSRPTLSVVVSAWLTRSTTDTVPVVAAPVLGSETIGVPKESLVVSPGFAGRPPSLATNASWPAITTPRGALPTGICLVSVLVAVSMTPSVFLPLSATYSCVPSAENAMPEGRPLLSAIVAVFVTVPSAATAKRIRSSDCGTHRDVPSGE